MEMNKNRTNEIDVTNEMTSGRPAGFEIQPFLSIHYGYKTVAEHRTNLIAL